jgi:BASS family bile acid:Na+ symporter
MTDFFQHLLRISVLLFSVSTMLSVGLGHTLRHVFDPMRDARAVIRALTTNFLLVPLLAYGVAAVLLRDDSYRTGLMLVATAAGAPFLIKLTATARGNVALSASLTMLLLPITVLYMPFVVPVVAPDAHANPAAIGLPLLWTMIIPMAVGLAVRARLPGRAQRLHPLVARLSTVALVVLLVSTMGAHFRAIGSIVREGAIFAPVCLILGAFVLGYAFGREYRGGHVVLGLGTAQRNIAAATVVATQGLDDPKVVVMVVVTSLVDLAVLFPIAWGLRRRELRLERVAHA